MADVLQRVETEHFRDDLPVFAPGDTLRVLYCVREGDKERIQAFEGVCIGHRGGGERSHFHGAQDLQRYQCRAGLPSPGSDRERC